MSKSSLFVYVASPGVDKRSENRAARYKREHAHRRALSGPTGEVGNEQLPYSAVNSREMSIPGTFCDIFIKIGTEVDEFDTLC